MSTIVEEFDWDKFGVAVAAWEQVIDRKAPNPLQGKRLNAEFTEWVMGLPKGWVTDVGLSWAQMIKACGNGVVPQQAKLALERLT
jgi:DNA (cytosine-5)-methyltransferase 1